MFEIVELAESDYPRIIALWQQAGLPFRPLGRDSQAAFGRQLASGVQVVLGAVQEDELVGVITVTHDSRKGWLNRLAVDPAQRRQGIGRALIAAAERWLHDREITVIAALIFAGNSASQAAFRNAGYTADPQVLYFSKRESRED